MNFVAFSLDQFELPIFRVDDKRYETLGAWLITDISVYFGACLDALALIDDVANGRQPAEEWSSDTFDVTFPAEHVSLRSQWPADRHGEYPVPEVREVLERYWRFLVSRPENPDLIREYRPDLPRWQAELLQWEERWGRPHPYRARLF